MCNALGSGSELMLHLAAPSMACAEVPGVGKRTEEETEGKGEPDILDILLATTAGKGRAGRQPRPASALVPVDWKARVTGLLDRRPHPLRAHL